MCNVIYELLIYFIRSLDSWYMFNLETKLNIFVFVCFLFVNCLLSPVLLDHYLLSPSLTIFLLFISLTFLLSLCLTNYARTRSHWLTYSLLFIPGLSFIMIFFNSLSMIPIFFLVFIYYSTFGFIKSNRS